MSPKLREQPRDRANGHGSHGSHGGYGGNGDHFGGRGPSGGGALPIPTPKLTFWLFLIMPTLIFSALTSAYVVRMGWGDWQSIPTPWTLWGNTAVLIASSVAIQWAAIRARRQPQEAESALRWLYVAGALGGLFMIGQLTAWIRLWGLGFGLAGNPAAGFFYLITAIHGLHLFGGLVAWLWTERRTRRGADPERSALRIELCAHYWHYLLAVWLVMFGLMEVTS